MKKISLFAILLILAVNNTIFAQANKSVFFELGGNGIGFSANFDSRITKNENGFGFRVGIGIIPSIDIGFATSSAILTIPVGINYLVGKAPNYFEGGIGATYITGSFSVVGSDNENGRGVGFVPSAGYRYAPIGKSFQGRIFISPLFGAGGSQFFAGLSVGYKF